MDEFKARTIALKYLRKLISLGIPVYRGVIFGSHAQGKANAWSDIDLLVISPIFDAPRTREDLNILWRIAADENPIIEPVPCGKTE
ncbi:MAG: nucleotidyltransferase domain-containing protein, partial [Desulfohalobiaceae bacterium]